MPLALPDPTDRNVQAWKHVYAELAHPIPELPQEPQARSWTA